MEYFGLRYGLLGPSGCGKSTLLHSIIGRHELDSGVIKVKANTIADIGFMPQVSERLFDFGGVFTLQSVIYS